MPAPSDTLIRAIQAAERRYTISDWHQIQPSVRTAAIYEELRRLDAASVGTLPVSPFQRRQRRRVLGTPAIDPALPA